LMMYPTLIAFYLSVIISSLIAQWIASLAFSCTVFDSDLEVMKALRYVVYKPPTTSKSAAKFYYVDSAHSTWTLAPRTISDEGVVVGATLQEYYRRGQGFVFPLEFTVSVGHSKGVVVFDEDTGFWLIHSVPNFPRSGSYSYPPTGLKFGQMFLCLTLPIRVLGDVGEQLRYVQATPFFSQLPIGQLITAGGMLVKTFAKHKKFNRDLWFDLVAPGLGTNLAVESWLNGGANDLESVCTERTSVYDVTSVMLPDISFNSSMDHSKWAVSDTSGGMNVICVGDLNRQKSQFRRGGGAVCFRHRNFWNTLHTTVKSVQPCNSKNIHSYFRTAFMDPPKP
uniref:Deoxyribonuclease II n=1 Tax=Angiostrongylus cantonensis TaxID=6313 RepID=A0A0K0DJP1_ANGCA